MQRGHFKQQLTPALELHVFPGFEDNYFYLLSSLTTPACIVVDPGSAKELLDYLSTSGRVLEAILLTHHHKDHTGGVDALMEHHPSAKIICSPWLKAAPSWQKYRIERVAPGVEFSVLQAKMTAIDVRGHTLDHIAFALSPTPQGTDFSDVFVGDSVFGAGCGGLFEGTHEQMLEGLKRIKALSANTRLWCAHEYTLKNLRVARLLNENNPAQAERLSHLETQLQKLQIAPHHWVTLPLTVGEERATNPFFRCDTPSLQKMIDTSDELATFKKVRAFRDQF